MTHFLIALLSVFTLAGVLALIGYEIAYNASKIVLALGINSGEKRPMSVNFGAARNMRSPKKWQPNASSLARAAP